MPSTSSFRANPNPETVNMIGLDFGSTTSSVMVASARIGANAATGRMELGAPRVLYRPEPVFTPFEGNTIDPVALNRHIDRWTSENGTPREALVSGGAIITGLAAERANANAIAHMVGARFSEALIATAADPRLESWLAFMGNCSALSRFHADTPFINLDIGGGTTNAAYGLAGNVLHTGCHFIGARHFQFEPGGYRLTGASPYGRALLTSLGIRKGPGQRLSSMETEAVIDFYTTALEAVATGDAGFFEDPDTRIYTQAPFVFDKTGPTPVLVFSGGVGELVYRQSQGRKIPGTTHYGDLGIDLAARMIKSPILSAHIGKLIPENMGRATVCGLTLHSTEISGSTLFLPSPEILPCRDLPIVARFPADAGKEVIRQAVSLAGASPTGACIQILPSQNRKQPDAGPPGCESLETIKALGACLHDAARHLKPGKPVVLLAPYNYGQTLGNYATAWRQDPFGLVVIDEVPDRRAQFVNIGRPRNGIVPISFYGIYQSLQDKEGS